MGTDLARYRHPERVIESTNLSTPADQRVDVMAASPDWQTGACLIREQLRDLRG